MPPNAQDVRDDVIHAVRVQRQYLRRRIEPRHRILHVLERNRAHFAELLSDHQVRTRRRQRIIVHRVDILAAHHHIRNGRVNLRAGHPIHIHPAANHHPLGPRPRRKVALMANPVQRVAQPKQIDDLSSARQKRTDTHGNHPASLRCQSLTMDFRTPPHSRTLPPAALCPRRSRPAGCSRSTAARCCFRSRCPARS